MYFIYRPDLHDAEEHPLDFIGWYSQDEESVRLFAELNPHFIYFEAELVTEKDKPKEV